MKKRLAVIFIILAFIALVSVIGEIAISYLTSAEVGSWWLLKFGHMPIWALLAVAFACFFLAGLFGILLDKTTADKVNKNTADNEDEMLKASDKEILLALNASIKAALERHKINTLKDNRELAKNNLEDAIKLLEMKAGYNSGAKEVNGGRR